MDLPADFVTFGYSNQKLNVVEMQKAQMRYQIATDHKNHYTYSKDYLGAAFPVVNLDEVEA